MSAGSDNRGDDEQRRRQDSEERFRTLVEYAPEAMVILDVDSGCFVDANSNACSLFGYSRGELLIRGPVDVSPEFQPDGAHSSVSAMSWIEQTVAGQHSVFEWVHCNADGEPVPCEVRLVRLPHQDRRWVRASILDISERKRAEADHHRLTAELAQAQKLQAIGQLTGGVAHDFNNLLTVIMSSVEMIENQADDPDTVRGFARQAIAAAQRAAALTQRLLAIARRQPLRPQVVDANQLLAGLESLLRRTLGESIEIHTEFGAELWTCEVDPAQLENVILNLAINGRDAMPRGGRLAITTGNATLQPGYAEHGDEAPPGEYVRLTVSDNGTGMEPRVLEHVFEPFFTTKEMGRGSGLGLSTIHGFVKQSGGDVRIDSQIDVGTTVSVFLPRSGADAARASRPPAASIMPRGDGLVLVVEDDPTVRALVVLELESLGYSTLDVADGNAGLEALATHPHAALLLTDVVLPGGMNGTELAARAASLNADLPVLYMSGYSEDAILHNGRLDPGVTLLEKPFSRRELAVAVRAALDAGRRSAGARR